jgi:hypothetical protein
VQGRIDWSDREPYTLGPERRVPLSGCPGFFMRFNRDIRKCVVFLGYPEYGSGPTKVHFQGTGFLLRYEDFPYLVTARHVATLLTETCAARVNKIDGTSINVIGENLPWVFHPDPTVDVAIVELMLPPKVYPGLDVIYMPQKLVLTSDMVSGNEYIELGDTCYTVGLFRVLTGNQRNLPVIHTGNLARLAGEEPIALKDQNSPSGTQFVDGHLVEAQSLSGLSGSPVFIRQSINYGVNVTEFDPAVMKKEEMQKVIEDNIKDGIDAIKSGKTRPLPRKFLQLTVHSAEVYLLGIWQAAWEAPAGEVIAIDRGQQMTVPVGMGVVVPASRILEVLESPVMNERRVHVRRAVADASAATPQAALRLDNSLADSSSGSDANPSHREDFTSLLNAAVKKPAQED